MDGVLQSEHPTFGDLLRGHRLAAALSQEALAERAGLSARGISDLERGARTRPHPETLTLLANALGLDASGRTAFFDAARRRPRSSHAADTAAERPSPLPVPLTTLIARDAEVAAVTGLLHDERVRLVTLTGPGGVGKTRLAIAVAEALNGAFGDGKVFVDLAPLHHPANVSSAIAAALGVSEWMSTSLTESLQRMLGGRQLLVVLDNYEHLLDAASVVTHLLRASASVKALVTSREALHVRGEREYLVQPLDLPNPHRESRPETLIASGAVLLFAERAAEADAHFRLTEENAPIIAAICRRLDGLPLAIELAAARTKLLPPAALLARLEQRLPLLTGGPRDAPARQRTLRDAIAWSYDLLTPEEQALFSRLGVFVGGWTLDVAEKVIDRGGGDDTLELLASLVDKSLIWRVEDPAETRFAMLETIREFALDQLRNDDLIAATRRAHAGYFVALAEAAQIGLVGAEQERWLARLDAEDGNFRAALAWTLEQGETEAGLRLARALWRYWALRGRLSDGRFWLERALGRPDARDAPAAVRADAHNAIGNLLGDSGEYNLAAVHFEEALTLRRNLHDAEGVAGGLNNLGLIAVWRGDYDGARRLHHESLAIRRELRDLYGESLSLSNLGDLMLAQGELAAARAFQEGALRLREAMHDATGIAYSRYNLGEIARCQGDLSEAARLLSDSLSRFETLGDRLGIAYAEWSMADVVSRQGDSARAAELIERALETREEIGDRRGSIECLETLGLIAIRGGVAADGVSLLGAALTEREALSSPAPPSSQSDHERALAQARQRIGAARVDALLHEPPRESGWIRRLTQRVIDRLMASEPGPPSPS
jgi:predicted ATPase